MLSSTVSRTEPRLPNEILRMLPQIIQSFAETRFGIEHEARRQYRIDLLTLRNLRLVNKAMCAFATPYLFRVIKLGGPFHQYIGRMRDLGASDVLQYVNVFRMQPPDLESLFEEHGYGTIRNDVKLLSSQLEKWLEEYTESLIKLFSVCPRQIALDIDFSEQPNSWWEDHRLPDLNAEPSAVLFGTIGRALLQQPGLRIKGITLRMRRFRQADCFWSPEYTSELQYISLHVLDEEACGQTKARPDNHDDLAAMLPVVSGVGVTVPKARCGDVIITGPGWGTTRDANRLAFLPPYLQQLRVLDIAKLRIDGGDLISIFEQGVKLEHCSLNRLYNESPSVRWSEIFDKLNEAGSLRSVVFNMLWDRNSGFSYPIGLYLDRNGAFQLGNFEDEDIDRPLESPFQSDYDALGRLLRKLVNNSRCDQAKRIMMEDYMQSHALHTREWLKANDPVFSDVELAEH